MTPLSSSAQRIAYIKSATSTQLRRMPPPGDADSAIGEWRYLVNLVADFAAERERMATRRAKPKKLSPQSAAGLDDAVLRAIDTGCFTSIHGLRVEVGCGFARLRASLARLTSAHRITRTRVHEGTGGVRFLWRKA